MDEIELELMKFMGIYAKYIRDFIKNAALINSRQSINDSAQYIGSEREREERVNCKWGVNRLEIIHNFYSLNEMKISSRASRKFGVNEK